MYGAECWPITKEMERRFSVVETRMLRWMGGITQLDRICNQVMQQRFGIVAIADKLHEARLRATLVSKDQQSGPCCETGKTLRK
ncbi:hypothetical protein ANCDUO_23772 [Ancylostoma duodenale]|uniref:Uncharacterized protein n=1 Tax=Ancylostoma duodenale TaxID=51022 RepID=A0A0C2C8V9_9BILA|nr:hypothetical protein ANCDUO_23772 [Ancylostoma duodenale]